MSNKKSVLRFSPGAYTVPYVKEMMDSPEAREEYWNEYIRLYHIAQKRLARIKNSEFNNSKQYQRILHDMTPPIQQMRVLKNELPGFFEDIFPNAMYDIATIVKKKTSSLSGLRDFRDTLIEQINAREDNPFRGLVSKENFQDYLDFMEEVKHNATVKQFKYELMDPNDTFDAYIKSKYGENSEQAERLKQNFEEFTEKEKLKKEREEKKSKKLIAKLEERYNK